MPTVRGISGPYRFFFYSFDCAEPKHIHVQRERMACKFWLEPIALAKNSGFRPTELNKIKAAIEDHFDQINEAWDEHFGE